MQEVTVVCKIPKEGTLRINPEILKTPTQNDLRQIVKEFVDATPSAIKPPEQKDNVNFYQRYHQGSEHFDRGWYDADVYDLTTYDWGNGQVMRERNWTDEVATQMELNDYTTVSGIYGGRDWNGWQVGDKGYLTGRLYTSSLIQQSGSNPIKALKNASRFLSSFGRLMGGVVSRGKLVDKIQNTKLKNIAKDLYRPGVKVGDRFESATGLNVGGKTHAIKLLNYRSALMKIWKVRSTLNRFDKRAVKELLKDIQYALQGD